MFASREILGLDRYVSFDTYAGCKITRFSYRSGNITKRIEFMHLRVRTTSAFVREKFAEVIFTPFPCPPKRRRHFPRGTNLSLSCFLPPPYALRLFISSLFPIILSVLFARPSLISLQVRGSRPMGKSGSNEKGD